MNAENRKQIRRRKLRQSLAAAVLATFGLAGVSQVDAQGRFDSIVQSGQAAPGAGGGSFSVSFLGLAMGNSGQVGFHSQGLTGTSGGTNNNEGLFLGNGTSLSQVVRKGDTAPGGNGTQLLFFGSPIVNNAGQYLFQSQLAGTSGGTLDNQAIYSGTGGTLTQLARKNQAAPGGGTISGFASGLFQNDQGHAVFAATLAGTSGGSADNFGFFRSNGGTLTQIARKGGSAAGNGTFLNLNNLLGLTSSGQAAFTAVATGTSGGAADDTGIFAGNGGAVFQIAREGQLAADGNGTYSFLNTASNGAMNDFGRVAFSATLNGTSGGSADNEGIFSGAGGAVTQHARKGGAAPGGIGAFQAFGTSDTLINHAGTVNFSATLAGTGGGAADDSAIFNADGATVRLMAREGQAVAGGNGTLSGSMNTRSINNSGVVAFRNQLNGTTGGAADDNGIFLVDGQDLITAAREGAALAGSTITSLGGQSTVNDFGQIAFVASLADGRTVLHRFTPDLHWRTNADGAFDANSNWTLGLGPASVHDVFIDTAGSVDVDGPASNRTVRTISIGGSTGQVQFALQNGAVLTAQNGVTVANKGTLTGDGVIAGNVTNQAGGTILADNLTLAGITTNHGTVRGNGIISANVLNSASGKIRALGGDTLHIAGTTFANAGLVEVNASELQLDGAVTNQASTGLVSLRNGSLIADAGIANQGSLALTLGASTVQGDINNTGTIQVSGGAHGTFFDDVIQNGVMQVSTVGATASTAVILGAFTGSGGFVGGGDVFALGDLRPGNSPASVLYDGNLFLGSSTDTFIELGGLGVGDFDQLVVTGDLNLAGSLSVALINGFTLGDDMYFSVGEVAGNLAGQFAGLGEGALVGNFGGRDLFLTYQGSNGSGFGLFTAIPEPSSLWTGLLVAGACMVRRRRA